ncbi:zinc finger CW-type PWWP domain protein 2 [Sturnira hondurensis]|uniref:zinc finger CW-type PWWP domain protein 2 n=1 Tax=Sturnira hondurensis TaxID=192404 RepID=UPI0018790577|nr:zinc finger CW-type PWWP domain protein 2 [Sturnira hondurensis]
MPRSGPLPSQRRGPGFAGENDASPAPQEQRPLVLTLPAPLSRLKRVTHPEDKLRRASEFRFPDVPRQTENKPGRQGSPRASGFLEDTVGSPEAAAAPGTPRKDSHFFGFAGTRTVSAPISCPGPGGSGRTGEPRLEDPSCRPEQSRYPATRARDSGPPAASAVAPAQAASQVAEGESCRGGCWEERHSAGKGTAAVSGSDPWPCQKTGTGRGGTAATRRVGGGAGRIGLSAFLEKEKFESKIIVNYCNTPMDSSVEDSTYVNKVWVQCENESCLKWRLLSSEDAAKVDHNEPWYCDMNSDSRYNQCSISEEDFPEESRFYQSGLKIVYSQLPLGSLVLVKLLNWPSWPGILCPHPFKGEYVTYDLDGNVEQYHIEFLGDPHSTSWIKATFVGHYSITLKPGECKKRKKKWYESALQEAYRLYGCSPEQRLDMCYLSKQDKSKAVGKVAVVAKKRMPTSKSSSEKIKPKFKKKKRKAILKSSFENVCSDDALSKENMVVSETEVLLKELEQMLQQALEPTPPADETEQEHGELINTGGKPSRGHPEASASGLSENHCEEDYVVIDGIKLKAGECIENITNKFKEIDALMSEF